MSPDLCYSMLRLTRLAVVSRKLSANWRCTAQARAEEEIDFTKVLRTGKTPYAKMDYQAPAVRRVSDSCSAHRASCRRNGRKLPPVLQKRSVPTSVPIQVFREGKCEPAQMGDLVRWAAHAPRPWLLFSRVLECLCRVKHRAWLENFEEGLPWELTLVGRMAVH